MRRMLTILGLVVMVSLLQAGEVRAGSATDKTTLEIKPEPERSPFGED